jgi:hypothetical protein
MKNYVGRKCKGFGFEGGTDNTPWTEYMENFIGKVGLIYDQDDYSVRIKFENDYWYYPISLIEEHLIPETPEIPQLGEGVEMEVSDNGIDWCKRKVVAQMHTGSFMTLVAQMHTGSFMTYFGVFHQYARPIQEVKKYTKEELVKILGHDFEIV